MKLIQQSHEILSISNDILQMIELAARTCYKSEDRITNDSACKFVDKLISSGHHAMIEFGDITVRFITNRGVTHELVRHRLCSFAQESTRYVRYDGDMEFIEPIWFSQSNISARNFFVDSCLNAEDSYKELLLIGWSLQQAREVLPNALKTEIVVKANIREWRHILKLRAAKAAHPQMYALMIPLLIELQDKVPVVFDDLDY